MGNTLNSLQYQINALENKLAETPKMIDGKYNRSYYSLSAKITNLKKELNDKCLCGKKTSKECLNMCLNLRKSWNEFLAK